MTFDEEIPFYSLDFQHQIIRDELTAAFQSALNKNQFILGKSVEDFEAAFASFTRVKYCAGVSNGLDALFLSLKVLDIGPGDEVIIPSNTYIATALAVSHCGAVPILVEPDLNTFNINSSGIEEKITAKTRAIIPVHLYGQACAMAPILDLAKRYSLKVVEDNAQAQGASYRGQMTGSFGHISATSFYPGKNLGALGDAGAITTNDPLLNESIQVMRNYGSKKKYYNDLRGFNMRLDELQAIFLKIKLKYLNQWNKARIQIADYYQQELSGIGDLSLPVLASDCTSVFHQFVIRTKKRDELQEYLTQHQIGTLIHYPIPVHLQKAYDDLNLKKGDLSIAEELSDTVLSLPVYPGMSEIQLQKVIDCIKNFFKNHRVVS